MKIFDNHCHLPNINQDYDLVVTKRNIIFNDIEEYKIERPKLGNEHFISLIFDYKRNLDFVVKEIKDGSIHAIKIHNRIQKIGDHEFPYLLEALKNANVNLPIIIDAFYYGHEIDFQPSLNQIIQIAILFNENPIIVAHSGGHKVLDYFLHLRTLKNIYFDISFSLTYLYKTSIFQDFKNLIHFSDKKKIVFGTDFPHVSGKFQYECFIQLCYELNLNQDQIEDMLFNNSSNIFTTSRGKSIL